MSLVARVIAIVRSRAETTTEDIRPLCPEYTHKQILNALGNAKDHGTVRVKHQGSYKAGRLTIWEPGKHEKQRTRKRKSQATPPPIASVWELGTPRDIPIPKERGRVFNLLGSWDGL